VDRAEIYTKVVQIIARVFKMNTEGINELSSLDSLGADSLNRVELVMDFEEAFGIEINDEEAEKFSTVGQIVDYIQSLAKNKEV
jgi:acyl carrier protein